MKLQHQTSVGAKPEDVWAFLQDTPAVVQCMPGAELVDDLGDDRYEGVLRVGIGPLKMNYAGEASVVERDAETHRIVLDASGRDRRGSGSVAAHVQLQVAPTDSGSRIDVVSDIDLTGRIASLGRGIRDVSNTMFVAFADQLSARVEHPGQTTPAPRAQHREAATATTTAAAPGRPPLDQAATSEIKVFSLLWTVTRTRFADFLERLSIRVRPS
ncbi:SRPBCC family protein [Mycobacterium sp. URHB0021]